MTSVQLERAITEVAKTGKYVLGSKEVLKSLNSSKIVIYSGSRDLPHIERIVGACTQHSIPVVAYDGSTEELGRLLGKRYSVSVVAVRSPVGEDLTAFGLSSTSSTTEEPEGSSST